MTNRYSVQKLAAFVIHTTGDTAQRYCMVADCTEYLLPLPVEYNTVHLVHKRQQTPLHAHDWMSNQMFTAHSAAVDVEEEEYTKGTTGFLISASYCVV